MSTCGAATTAVYEYVQAGAGDFGSVTLPANYILSAPLVDGTTLFVGTAVAPTPPGWTKKLSLFGATAFRVRVDASLVAYVDGTPPLTSLYVSAGISTADEIVQNWTGTPALPAGTVKFQFGILQDATGVNYASTSATVTATVPPGVYYV